MRIGEDTIFGRIALALEGIFKKVAEVPVEAYSEVAKDIGEGHETIVLKGEELNATVIKVSGAGDASLALVLSAATKKLYVIDNQSGQTVTVKLSDSNGTAVATKKRSLLWCNGTDVVPAIVS